MSSDGRYKYGDVTLTVTRGRVQWSDDWSTITGRGLKYGDFKTRSAGPGTYGHDDVFVANWDALRPWPDTRRDAHY